MVRLKDFEQFPAPPRFVSNREITRKGSVNRLFKPSIDPPDSGRLSASEELVLFKRMQYCAYRMSKMWDRLEKLNKKEQAQYLKWYKRYHAIRDRIINANMGLVFDLLRKTRFKNVEFEELRSEGLMALLRAVDVYDPWSGYRFSTYACNAILNSFSRVAMLQSKRRHLWSVSYEPSMEPGDQTETSHQDYVSLLRERLSKIIREGRAELNESEQFVLNQRFPLHEDRSKATLKQVGESMQISKERVRQIQEAALSKLRRALLSDAALQ